MKTKNNIIGVYAWVVDGVIRYIGSGKDITNSRKSNHLAKLRQGKHHIDKLQEIYEKCGEESFQFVILKECLVRDLYELEKYFKDLHKETIYNLNEIPKKKKAKKTGLKAKYHKDKFRKMFSGEKNPNCQTSIDVIIQIKLAIRKGLKNKDIAKLFGKSPSYISLIKNEHRWKSVDIPEDYVLFEGVLKEQAEQKEREHEKKQI